MKKNAIILSALICSSLAFSQVGINTPNPRATFDITAKTTTGTDKTSEGLLVPRVDRLRAQSMSGVETSTLIYINSIATGSQGGNAVNIDKEGYYYFDGALWVKLTADASSITSLNIYNSDGTLTANRTVFQEDKNLTFSGTTGTFQVNGNNDGFLRSTFKNTSTGANSRMDVGIGAGSANIYLGTDNGSTIFGTGTKAYLDNRTGGRFVIGNSGVEQVTINNTDGNVGIGNITPAQRLSVVDAGNANQYQGTASFLANNLTRGVGIGYGGIQAIGSNANADLNLNAKAAGNIIMQTSGTTGYVGIGTASPHNTLDLGLANGGTSAAAAAGKKLALFNNSAGTDFYGLGINTGKLQFHAGSAPADAPAMVLSTAGSVGIGTTDPDARAILDLSATNRGFLPPRLTTTQRDALSNRPAGLMIYNVNTNCMDFWNSSVWVSTCAVTAPPAGSIATLTCASATNNGTIVTGSNASVTSSIPYTGGNGGSHGGQVVTSTGVTGLTATLAAGSFATGAGSLTYIVTGTPSAIGTANFAINIGGKTCTLSRAVTLPAGAIASINCATATNNGTLTGGTAASGVSSVISYTGGNTGTHGGQVVTSTGVTGLTASLTAGAFANGNGTLTYTITGTPAASGTASFAINIGGKTCTLTRTVTAATTPPVSPGITCTTNSFLIPYTANGGTVSGTVNGTPVTATITSTNIAQGPAMTNCFGITQSSTFRGSGAAGAANLTIKFNRKVSNAKVYDTFTGGAAGTSVTYKNNGVVVNPTGTAQFTNCGYGLNTTSARPAEGVWYDEIVIGITSSSKNIEMICVGSVQ